MKSRPNPFVWTGEEAPQGVFVGGGADDGLSLLGLPQGLRRKEAQRVALEHVSDAARTRLSDIADALGAGAEGARRAFKLDDLSDNDRAYVLDLLGDGEVNALIATADGLVQASETVFPGLWVLRREDAPDTAWVEIGDVPALARDMAASVTRDTLPLEHMVPPDGAMNVMGVLAEIRHIAQTQPPGAANHVLNFTLMPMTEADTDFLAAVLGQGPVRFASGGYGTARVILTGLRNVWAVQYLNSMGVVILDTIEIGDVPQAACAQREDFEDSAERLRHILAGEAQ